MIKSPSGLFLFYFGRYHFAVDIISLAYVLFVHITVPWLVVTVATCLRSPLKADPSRSTLYAIRHCQNQSNPFQFNFKSFGLRAGLARHAILRQLRVEPTCSTYGTRDPPQIFP